MPSVEPPTPRRPKLSLQTFAAVSSAAEKTRTNLTGCTGTETPVRTNTYADGLAPSHSATSCILQIQDASLQACPDDQVTPPSSSSSSATSSSSGHTSPFPMSAPYSLPIGARSILRNSPLPRKHLSVASTRMNRRMFTPVKRVTFREILDDIIPARAVDDSSDSDCGEKRPRATFERVEISETQSTKCVEEVAFSIPSSRRRKRRREWVWRPWDNDVLAAHHGLEEYNEEDKVELASPAYGKSIELELNLPIVLDDAYSRSGVELGYKQEDTRVRGSLILQKNFTGTEIELQNPTVEMVESRQH
ncbi:hypothetical protein MMC07_005562 [Pseudocyphellaria aurata]|nr:hypothetical protein [Pseudocyphellaria aurata]